MASEHTTKVGVVRCPRCRLLQPEPYCQVFKCGGCGAVLQAKNRVRKEKRSEGLVIETAPVEQLLNHVSRDSETVSNVRARNRARFQRSEGFITEPASVDELSDQVSHDSETVSSDASMGGVRARTQTMNGRSESFRFDETEAPGNQLGVFSADIECGTSSVSSMLISHHTSSNGENNDYHDVFMQKMKANFEDWSFLIASIFLEILSAAFDQASSPSKSHYALFGMLLSIVAVITCIWEFIHKVKRERVESGRWGVLWWFYHSPPRSTLFGTFPDILALVGAIPQCIFSIVQYVYHSRHADNPINLCLWPIVFHFCLVGSKLLKNQNKIAQDLVLRQCQLQLNREDSSLRKPCLPISCE